MVELFPYTMPRLKQVDSTVTLGEPVKRIFPFGSYTNGKGEWVEVDDDAFFYSNREATREEVSAMFPLDFLEGQKISASKTYRSIPMLQKSNVVAK